MDDYVFVATMVRMLIVLSIMENALIRDGTLGMVAVRVVFMIMSNEMMGTMGAGQRHQQ